jgi:hypothetical protein
MPISAPPARRPATRHATPAKELGHRALIAAPAQPLPTPRRPVLLVTPATILRSHQQLVAHRRTTAPTRPSRSAIPQMLAGPRFRAPQERGCAAQSVPRPFSRRRYG